MPPLFQPNLMHRLKKKLRKYVLVAKMFQRSFISAIIISVFKCRIYLFSMYSYVSQGRKISLVLHCVKTQHLPVIGNMVEIKITSHESFGSCKMLMQSNNKEISLCHWSVCVGLLDHHRSACALLQYTRGVGFNSHCQNKCVNGSSILSWRHDMFAATDYVYSIGILIVISLCLDTSDHFSVLPS